MSQLFHGGDTVQASRSRWLRQWWEKALDRRRSRNLGQVNITVTQPHGWARNREAHVRQKDEVESDGADIVCLRTGFV